MFCLKRCSQIFTKHYLSAPMVSSCMKVHHRTMIRTIICHDMKFGGTIYGALSKQNHIYRSTTNRRTFHITPRRDIAPFIWAFFGKGLKLVGILSGRYVSINVALTNIVAE